MNFLFSIFRRFTSIATIIFCSLRKYSIEDLNQLSVFHRSGIIYIYVEFSKISLSLFSSLFSSSLSLLFFLSREKKKRNVPCMKIQLLIFWVSEQRAERQTGRERETHSYHCTTNSMMNIVCSTDQYPVRESIKRPNTRKTNARIQVQIEQAYSVFIVTTKF